MAWKNCCRLLPGTILATCLCLPSLLAQSSGYLAVGQPQTAIGKRNAEVQVAIPVTVRQGYHVNSNTPSEDYLVPLKLTWTSTGALQPGAVTFPKPTIEKYQFAEMPLSVFTGSFNLVAHFKVKPDATRGPGAASGKLRYQACSNIACYAPKTVDVTVVYQVQ